MIHFGSVLWYRRSHTVSLPLVLVFPRLHNNKSKVKTKPPYSNIREGLSKFVFKSQGERFPCEIIKSRLVLVSHQFESRLLKPTSHHLLSSDCSICSGELLLMTSGRKEEEKHPQLLALDVVLGSRAGFCLPQSSGCICE